MFYLLSKLLNLIKIKYVTVMCQGVKNSFDYSVSFLAKTHTVGNDTRIAGI